MSTRRKPSLAVIIIALSLVSYLVSFSTPAAGDDTSLAKVVYHVDFAEPQRLSAMLGNIYNMATTYENDFREYDIRVVFNAQGIRFLTNELLSETPFAVDKETAEVRDDLIVRLQSLQDSLGISLSLCNITREAINLPEDKIIPGVTLVTSGVVEVANLQHQGFAYLKVQ